MSMALRIVPLILLAKKDFSVFSWSSDCDKVSLSSFSTALHNPIEPHCIISTISNTPEACCDVANFLPMFSTNGKNSTLSSSSV